MLGIKRTEEQILSELEKAKKEWHEKRSSLTEAEQIKFRETIRALNDEYFTHMIDGCKPCEKCGQLPVGLHQPTKVRFKETPESKEVILLQGYYEIGCVSGCQHSKGKEISGRPQNLRTFAMSREGAVDNWNKKKFFLRIYP